MYRSPIFMRFGSSRWPPSAGASWLWLAPGVSLMLLALAILVWPELLAYLVAGAILLAGMALTGWGWTLRQAARRVNHGSQVRVYREGESI